MALIVVHDEEGRKALAHVDNPAALKKRALVQPVCDAISVKDSRQICRHLDLRVVGALAQNLLWNRVERQREAGGESGQYNRVIDKNRTGKRIAQHGEMLLDQ